MYQINLSLSKDNLSWFKSIQEALEMRVKECCGIIAHTTSGNRINISIAAEPEGKSQINSVIKTTLVDMYSKICKMEFLKKNLVLPKMAKSQYKILLHTLVAFDRECERELISNAFSVSNGIALDGIYNFRLKELRTRWTDICKLTEENAAYLTDEATFTELIRFLISAINPKIQKITISDERDKYELIGELDEERINFNIEKDELIYYLVDLAPMEITLVGDFKDQILYNQIVLLFDAKDNRPTKIWQN